MVRLEGETCFYQASDFSAAIIPLDDEKLSLMVISPANSKFESVRSGLSATLFNDIIEGAAPVCQVIYLPLSVINHSVIRENFGIASDEYFADFSVINNKGFLSLKQVLLTTDVSVSTAGLQSQSKSLAILDATPDEPPSVFDDGFYAGVTFTTSGGLDSGCYYPAQAAPFIFVLFNSETNTILNIGQVVEVDGEFVGYDWSKGYATECGLSPPVDVYKYKGSLQCQLGSGTDLTTMQQTLIDASIEVIYSREDYDGLAYTAVCDAPNGKINVFTIREHQLDAAKALGFDLLSNLVN